MNKTSPMSAGKLEKTVIYQLWETYSTFQRYRDSRSDSPLHSLGLTQWQVLNLIHNNPGCSQASLAGEVGINRASISSIIVALVKKNLVQREAAQRRNTNSLSMTAAGSKEIRSFYKEIRRMEKEICTGMGEEQAARAISLLEELRTVLTKKILD